jgi:hypothetical protein
MSPLQEYVLTTSSDLFFRLFVFFFLQNLLLKQATAEIKNFGGLAVFQSLRIRLEDP